VRQIKRHAGTILRGFYPGQIVAVDTFYVGHLKGVGRVYQFTGIDLCARYGWAKLYTAHTQASAIDFVETVLLPKFFANGLHLESLLSDNGSEFIGHDFERALTQYDIGHHRIAPGRPVQNGYCERFQRTLLEEFYQPVFRTQFFRHLEELQAKLNEYLAYYDFRRVHFGLKPKGACPIDVFKAKHKMLQQRFHQLLT
jgi:transposase InsO family protein